MPNPQPSPNSETQEMSRARDSFIGPYKIDVKIGDGGMGVVYKCYDSKLKRFVALKVLKEKYISDPTYNERFRREAQAVASLSHSNVTQIFSIEEGDGSPPYLVMEYVDGSSAETLLKAGGSVSPARATAIVRDAAMGLRAALQKGIIHRDVKPSNILIALDGSVKLVDFGLAKEIKGADSLTEDGMVVGTPHYISPEQGRGHKVDQRSDIYSLGATFYHLVTGRPPFEGDSQLAVIVAHLNKVPDPPHKVRSGIPESISLVIGKMMAKDPERRYPGYQELLEDLDRLLRGEGISQDTAADGAATFRSEPGRIPARFWMAAIGAMALAVVLTLLLALNIFPLDKGSSNRIERLGSWLIRQDRRTECLDITFSSPPSGLTRSELLGVLFLQDPAEDGALGIELPGPSLKLKDLPGPIGLRFPLLRVDEMHVKGVRMEGRIDFGVALIDPDGAALRSLLFAIRSDQPTIRDPSGRSDEPRESPILARRNGDPIPLNPVPPPLLHLGAGPYELDILLRSEGERTRIHFAVKGSGGTKEVYASDPGEGLVLPGNDWSSGALLLWAPSPLRRGSLWIERIVLVGLLDHRRSLDSLSMELE